MWCDTFHLTTVLRKCPAQVNRRQSLSSSSYLWTWTPSPPIPPATRTWWTAATTTTTTRARTRLRFLPQTELPTNEEKYVEKLNSKLLCFFCHRFSSISRVSHGAEKILSSFGQSLYTKARLGKYGRIKYLILSRKILPYDVAIIAKKKIQVAELFQLAPKTLALSLASLAG